MIKQAQFEQCIDEHYQALYRYALWMTGEADLALDLVQETYYQAWKARHSLRDVSKVFYWLLSILRRAVFREYTRNSKWKEWVSGFHYSVAEECNETDMEALLDVARAMQSISPGHRDILLLYLLYGYSYAEIAEYLGVPVGTVMSRIARARSSLNKVLKPEHELSNSIVSLNRYAGQTDE